jgi:hypothetical protein
MTGDVDVKFASGSPAFGKGVEAVWLNGNVVGLPPYPGYVEIYPTGSTQ